MVRLALFLACLALVRSHAVLPVVPAVHSIHAPLVVPYPLTHGYGHGLYGYGLVKPLGHHLLKRHIVAPYSHAVAPLAAVAPVAVSHQSRVDYHSSPALASYPLVKPLVTPYLAAPYLKPYVAPYYGLGHEGFYHR